MSETPRSSARLWGFRLLAATVLPLAVLVAVETSLRLVGSGHDSAFTVPCTVAGEPSFCDNPRFTWLFFPPSIARTPRPFAIPREKAEGTYRIFVVGGSAAQGDPNPSYGVARQLRLLLEDRHPDVRFEVVNAAITAINSHVVRPIVHDLARRDPDLFVVYLGNNEVVGPYGAGTVFSPMSSNLGAIRASVFVRGTRIGQLVGRAAAAARNEDLSQWHGMKMFVDRTVREKDPSLQTVYSHFDANLRAIVETATSAGAEVVLSTVGTNLKDNPPFVSLHRPIMAPDAEKTWQAVFDRGVEYETAGWNAKALAAYKEAESIDEEYADLHYRIAGLYLGAGDSSEARKHFVRARDLDALRFRADSRINEIIREVARAEEVPLVDAAQAFEQASPDGLPGAELFFEHVHLNFHGNYVLARALLDRIETLLPDSIASVRSDRPVMEEDACRARLAYTAVDEHRVLAVILSRMSAPPFSDRFEKERTSLHRRSAAIEAVRMHESLQTAEEEYEAALKLWPDDPWLHGSHAGVLQALHRNDEAEAEYRAHLTRLPQDAYARADLADLLAKNGRYEEALAECRQVLEILPGETRSYATMAFAQGALGRWDESIATKERMAQIDPDSAPAILQEIAETEFERGHPDRAAQLYDRSIRQREQRGDTPEPDLWSAYGAALVSAGRTAEAREALDRALAQYDAELKRSEPRVAARRGREMVTRLLDSLSE